MVITTVPSKKSVKGSIPKGSTTKTSVSFKKDHSEVPPLIETHPDDSSIHTRRTSSPVSKASSNSSVATIENVPKVLQFDTKDLKDLVIERNQAAKKAQKSRESQTPRGGRQKNVKKKESRFTKESIKKSRTAVSVTDLRSISAGHTDDEIIRALSKKLDTIDSHLDLRTLGRVLRDSMEPQYSPFQENEMEDVEEEEEEQEEEIISEEEEPEVEEEENDDLEDNNYYEKKQSQLIERYLTTYSEYKYIFKKNLYLQDKLYHICLQKGFIVTDEKGQPANKKRAKSKNKIIKPGKIKNQLNTVESIHQYLHRNEEETEEPEIEELEETLTEFYEGDEILGQYKTTQLSNKYNKVIQRVNQTMKSKSDITEDSIIRLVELERKRDENEEKFSQNLDEFMNRIRTSSLEGIDAHSSHHLGSALTEQYISEMYKLFDKLTKTTVLFYKNWHGLHLSLKHLERSQTQEGEGLHLLEYEQLVGENEILKDKADYREQELEKAKLKISHCKQVLAHFKESEKFIDTNINYRSMNLEIVNKRIRQLSEIMELVTIMYSLLREEQNVLSTEGNLFDNVKLMRDFETTNYQLRQLKETKVKILQQIYHEDLEIKELKQKIIKVKDPKFEQLVQERKLKEAQKVEEKLKRDEERKRIKQLKMENLLFLLERRTVEPWMAVREELVVPNIYRESSSHNLRMIL